MNLAGSSRGSGSTAQLKPDAMGAAGSWYFHRVLYELDVCDLDLYEFVNNCIQCLDGLDGGAKIPGSER